MAGRGRSGRGGSAADGEASPTRGKKNLTEAELREGLSLNAEISGEALVEPAEAKAGVTRAATVKRGASVLERVCAVHSALEYYLEENPNVARLYRNADDE
ncbi:unnamed protein product, partial [Ectocarpus sp. 12 AP-2014]